MNSLRFENRGDYLYFKFRNEPIDLAKVRLLMERVIGEIRSAGIPRVVFEVENSDQLLDIKDYYTIAESLGREISGLKAAILTSPDLHTPEVAFFELATGSAGNQLRYFSELAKAESWLRKP